MKSLIKSRLPSAVHGGRRQPNWKENDEILSAAGVNDVNTLHQLSSKGVDVTAAYNWNESTALHIAAQRGSYQAVKMLLDINTKTNVTNNVKSTPLHYASGGGHQQVVKLLIDSGAVLRCKDKDSKTPLHLAANRGHHEVVKMLVDAGATVDAKDKHGNTPLTYAIKNNHRAVVNYLINETKASVSKEIKQCLHQEGILGGEVIDPAAAAFAYEQAVKQGVHEANQFKIVMMGAEGAGKTSTVHSLLDEEFQPDQPSTIGADTHSGDVHSNITADRIFSCNWRTRELQHHLDEISVHYKQKMKQEMTKTLNNVPLETESKTEVLQSKTETHNKVSESAGMEVLQTEVTYNDDTVRIIIYDLGGQELYYVLHYLFLASHDVVFLTFNASISLDEPVVRRYRYTIFQTEYKTRATLTTYDVIEATLHAIYSHCGVEGTEKSLSPRNPTIIMVATHSVSLSPDEKESIADKLFSRIPVKLRDHFPSNRSDAIHFIDNEKRDGETFNRLKAVALKAAAYTLSEQRPITYLKFEEELLTMSLKENEISKERAFDITTKAGLEPTNEALETVLQYYTDKGILLYYPDHDALKNTIFISPQKISKLITCVIRTHDYAEPRLQADLHNKCIRFDKYGLLEETLLDCMAERSGHSKNIVLGLLEKFELAIEIDRGTKFTNEPDFYLTPDSGRVFFVPSMLVHNETQDYVPPKSHIVNTILYYFPDKFIPDTVFNHVLILVTKWCNNQSHRIRCVYYGIGVFDFSNDTQSFTLQHCSDTYSIKCHVYVHKEEMQDKDLWQQRWDLLQLIQSFVSSVHTHYIPKAAKPITYVECPLPHDKECAPHVRLDAIKPNTFCYIFNECISVNVYNLLLEPTNQSLCVATGISAAIPVRGAVIFHEIGDKEKTPNTKDLYDHVIYKHSPHWREIGVQLKLKNATLDNINEDYRKSATCFERTLQKWLEVTLNATWRELEIAITNARRAHLGLKPVTDVYGIDE